MPLRTLSGASAAPSMTPTKNKPFNTLRWSLLGYKTSSRLWNMILKHWLVLAYPEIYKIEFGTLAYCILLRKNSWLFIKAVQSKCIKKTTCACIRFITSINSTVFIIFYNAVENPAVLLFFFAPLSDIGWAACSRAHFIILGISRSAQYSLQNAEPRTKRRENTFLIFF